MTQVTCWHFAGETLRDGRPLPKKGETLRHEGEVVPCKSGLHGSKRAIDALSSAPGWNVARVRLSGTIVPHGDPVDKYAASIRTNLTDYVSAKDVLVALSRRWALRALRVHAAGALRKAGLLAEAEKLEALEDDCDLAAARSAANDASLSASDASRSASFAAGYASDAASCARSAASYASSAARDASDASDAAHYASDASIDASSSAEEKLQNTELESELKRLFGRGGRK